MLHKVECVVQPDELSLWRGKGGRQRNESEERKGRREGWDYVGGEGGWVFNMGKVYVYLKE